VIVILASVVVWCVVNVVLAYLMGRTINVMGAEAPSAADTR
jgi:hypothetical protein